MQWKTVSSMDQKIQLIADWQTKQLNIIYAFFSNPFLNRHGRPQLYDICF